MNPLITEYQAQCALVDWARLKGLPLIAIPNGGKRTRWEGARQKKLGLLPGVSDLFLAIPSRGFGGFWIEMKTEDKEPTIEQMFWIELMRHYGYKAEWYNDWTKDKQDIEEYLK
ncbi:MAG TPA: VRR-NUC domain-containing protein [Candidatus Babeliales bacterium]|jgi:hypothetical protein|nr:VRR-NUC domain-containing protein [Candidatus Babeliales bacterium]